MHNFHATMILTPPKWPFQNIFTNHQISNNFSNCSNRLKSLSHNTDHPSDIVSLPILIIAYRTTIKNNATTMKLMIFGKGRMFKSASRAFASIHQTIELPSKPRRYTKANLLEDGWDTCRGTPSHYIGDYIGGCWWRGKWKPGVSIRGRLFNGVVRPLQRRLQSNREYPSFPRSVVDEFAAEGWDTWGVKRKDVE